MPGTTKKNTATAEESGAAASEYVEVSISIVSRIRGSIPFDIYIRRAKSAYTKLFKKGDSIDEERISSYRDQKHVATLFVSKPDYQQYLLYVERIASASVGDNHGIPTEEMVGIVKEMANLTMREVLSPLEIDHRAVDHAMVTVQGCVNAMNKEPVALVHLLKLLNKEPYLIKHSVATAIFSLLLAKAEKLEGQKTLMIIGLGALLHDIGLARLTFSAEDAPDLTPEQRLELRQHPEQGKRMLEPLKGLFSEVRLVVLQHHEQPNGSGYPNGIRDMYYPAKIVSICDSFSALISERPYRKAVPLLEALNFMKEDRGKFDQKLLETFTRLLMPVKMDGG